MNDRSPHAWPAILCGAITASVQWLIWRSLDAVPAITDEASYLLQARLFAHLRWTAPAAPLREFFEQAHVIITPVTASKYPPGHALLLAIGAALGKPGLVPILLSAITAAFVFVVARRLKGTHVAVLAWFLWTFAPIPAGFRPSYFSQATTAATWMLGWWALLHWREDRRTRWLVLVSIATAWCAITRPITAVAYALPLGVVVLTDVWQRKDWRSFGIAVAGGMAVIAIMPLWSRATLGSISPTPYSAYNAAYIPFEHLGFGSNGRHTPTDLPRDLYDSFAAFDAVHAAYTPALLGSTIAERAQQIWSHFFGRTTWSALLGVFIPIGIVALGGAGWFAGSSVIALFAAYLLYAHPAVWTLYYYEALAPLSILAAAGVVWAIAFVYSRVRKSHFDLNLPIIRRAVWIVVVLCLPFALAGVGATRVAKMRMTGSQTAFARALAEMPKPAIVFIRYAPNHLAQASLMDNDADFEHSPVWRAYDRGPEENARLRALAPNRHAFLFDQQSQWFVKIE
jgi:hypothetical protein